MKLRVILWSVPLALAGATATRGADYLREVKPLLAAHCYRCHGAQQQKGGLRLDTAASARKGGEHGPAFQPGNSGPSLLAQVVAGAHGEISRMPYKKPPLTEKEIALLRSWIDAGAGAPADELAETARHWAFVAPVRPEVPRVSKSVISRSVTNGVDRSAKTDSLVTGSLITENPIDSFIFARLDKEGIAPSAEADRVTLLRRVSLDLTGLPPTPQEVNDFMKDRRADAWERVVERLLASPHYGERWGRWWLDAARYADSNGYSIDAPRSVWKYRDWVIAALNRDMPFDQFATWQLAGDLLPPDAGTKTLDPIIATGFHRNTQINQEGGIDPEQFRVESVVDRVGTTATAFLGVTLACAQCHDHKFDPFTQRDFYRMFAFFNSTVEDGHGKGTPGGVLEIPGEFEGGESVAKELEEAEEELGRYLNTKGSELQRWEKELTAEQRAKLKSEVRKVFSVPFAERTTKQKRTAYAAFRPDDAEFKSRNTKLAKLEKREPKPVTTLVMRELDQPRQTHLHIKGDFTRPGVVVTPGTPESLPSMAGTAKPTRLDLARWIVATNNPLTARVLVNRVWQQYFGRGLVETENDFGTQGSAPTHPELLDWLACEFAGVERGSGLRDESSASPHSPLNSQPKLLSTPWSLKRLHRLIVTSATYRQSSKARPELRDKDPNNKLLARQSRLRLDAEAVRDVTLAASGLLSRKMGGPPVFPPQPAGVMTLGQSKREWKPSAGDDRHRRGIYTHFWRATPHPALAVFDVPDAFSACTRRLRSNTPLQALTLLNDQQFYEMAQALGARVVRERKGSDAERLDYAFRLCLARAPSAGEKERLMQLLASEPGSALADDGKGQPGKWTALARVLLNLDETITRE